MLELFRGKEEKKKLGFRKIITGRLLKGSRKPLLVRKVKVLLMKVILITQEKSRMARTDSLKPTKIKAN